MDVWLAARSTSSDAWLVPWGGFFPGVFHTTFIFTLSPDESKELYLKQHGVPDDATILELGFTSQGAGCHPLLWHGNRVDRRFLGTKFSVFGLPLRTSNGERLPQNPGNRNIAASVTWVPSGTNSEAAVYLTDAFDAMINHDYRHLILPAHAAAEITLMPLVHECLAKRVSKERAQRFVRDEISYSSALNIVLPLLGEIFHLPVLRKEIRGELNRLREIRNQYVHEGLRGTTLSGKDAAEMLCGAVFGIEYFQYFRTRALSESAQAGPFVK